MKPVFKFNFLAALACTVLLVACSDDDKDRPKTESELIGSGIAWKISTATANGFNVISLIDDCLLDNLVTFNFETTISTGVLDAGATKCDSTEPQTINFTWSYNETTKVLTVDTEIIEIPGSQGELMVESVTTSELVLSQNVLFAGLTQKAILTLIH